MINFKELREQLTDERIKDILSQFDVLPYSEDAKIIIFPTCCHNLENGSPKLYYYKNTKLFYCFTGCQETFDIFTLLQKMYSLRNKEISLRQAVDICELDTSDFTIDDEQKLNIEEIKYMQQMNNHISSTIQDFRHYDKTVLKNYPFDYIGLLPWIQEGIDIQALRKFSIGYDNFNNAITIPNFDYEGNLIGIRERFFREEDVMRGKYRPMYDIKKHMLYSHPTGRTFYGIYENHKAIERKHMAIIFEGEKSLLKYETIYGNENNIALATLGQNITIDHIQELLKMKVNHVILAYDTDYEDEKQLQEVTKKYIEKAKILSPYLNVSVLFDYSFLLPYKSSPIDGGKEIFEKILEDRRIVK